VSFAVKSARSRCRAHNCDRTNRWVTVPTVAGTFSPQRPILRLDGHGYSPTLLQKIVTAGARLGSFADAAFALGLAGLSISAREYQRDYRHTAGAPAAHPDIPTLECVLSAPRYEDIRQAFERLRFEIAAGLVGFTPWYVVARDLLLSWGDRTAARCLATYYPPLEVVRELHQFDPKKYARVKWAANAYAKS
jgi:hypothetical protein